MGSRENASEAAFLFQEPHLILFEPLYSASYEPIWAAAAANNMTLNHHAGGATPNFGNHFPSSLAVFMLEVSWWSQRALWHLIFSEFERHPSLKWINTETGTAWVPETLKSLIRSITE